MTTIFFGDIDDDWTPPIDDDPVNIDDEFHGGGGNDILSGDRWYGIAGGNDFLFGDSGNDYLSGGAAGDIIYGGTGNDTITADGHREGGPSGYDQFDGADLVLGNEGNDKITTEGGNDTLYGGAGADTLNGGTGIDLASYAGGTAGVEVWLGGFTHGGDAQGDVVSTDIENLEGTDSGDAFVGSTADNVLTGHGGDDVLDGRDGEDQLLGGAGDDVMFGGAGEDDFFGGSGDRDLVDYRGNAIGVVVRIGLGTAGGGEASGDEIAIDVEMIHGSNTGDDLFFGSNANNSLWGNGGNDSVYGEGGADILHGDAAEDRLEGGAGGDLLYGGAGNDTYVLNDSYVVNGANTWDAIREGGGDGIDTVYAASNVGRYTYLLEPGVENLVATAGDVFRLWGNELDNSLTGNAAGNVIDGFAGNDYLYGGLSEDELTGGTGDDTYVLEDTFATSEFSVLHYDSVSEGADAGTDKVLVNSDAPSSAFSPGYTLGANIEDGAVYGGSKFYLRGNELFNGLTGNATTNSLTGYGGADRLEGGGGIDTLTGGLGNDTYVLSDTFITATFSVSQFDTVVEAAGGGMDRVLVNTDAPWAGSFIAYHTLGAEIENGVLDGGTRFDLRGNELNNRLAGNDAKNKLSGFAGNDRLDGGEGADTLVGGLGNDTYVLNDTFITAIFSVSQFDTVVEAAGGGTDRVLVDTDAPWTGSLTAFHTLGAEIENGILAGGTRFNLTGNALDNGLTGNDEANRLQGGGGGDRLDGSLGNDVLSGGAGADTLTGGLGREALAGNAGRDVFDFNAVVESGIVNPTRDVIADFVHLADDLDLSTIDARTGTMANDAFAFIGSAAFTFSGQIRATQAGANTLVQINTLGPADAEMSILLSNFTAATLTAADFVL